MSSSRASAAGCTSGGEGASCGDSRTRRRCSRRENRVGSDDDDLGSTAALRQIRKRQARSASSPTLAVTQTRIVDNDGRRCARERRTGATTASVGACESDTAWTAPRKYRDLAGREGCYEIALIYFRAVDGGVDNAYEGAQKEAAAASGTSTPEPTRGNPRARWRGGRPRGAAGAPRTNRESGTAG